MTGLRRDGHLTDLALEYLLDDEPLSGTEQHLAACSSCASRLQAARELEVPPRAVVRTGPPRWMFAAGAGLALAASALLVVSMPTPGDGIRVKGADVVLQVFRDEGPTSRQLFDGDLVQPGDRLGFRVRLRRDGHFMVVGTDGVEAYACYPQGEAVTAVEVAGQDDAVELDAAIRLDDARGMERLVLLWCDSGFDFDVAAEVAMDGAVPPGCLVHDLTLEKQ